MNETKITVVEVNNVAVYPPVISLLECMADVGFKISFIGNNIASIPIRILEQSSIEFIEIGEPARSRNILKRLYDEHVYACKVKNKVEKSMEESEILWTTSFNTVKVLGNLVTNYKNIMQFMELIDEGYKFKHFFKIPLKEYAQKAWKVVVPEINRAYIQKTIWDLENLPYVFPNKPYNLEVGEITEDMVIPLDKVSHETKKIVLYLGGIWPDRDLKPFASAIKDCGEYKLYIIGKAYGESSERHLEDLISNYDVEYLGSFVAPKHLEFVKFAHIGILSYTPVKNSTAFLALNQLYCAPNKIYEYAAYRVPMIGNDILGLKYPFEKYGIGYTCNENDTISVRETLRMIEDNYSCLQDNCEKFYRNTDLKSLLLNIIND